jgi:hypothetical protein
LVGVLFTTIFVFLPHRLRVLKGKITWEEDGEVISGQADGEEVAK